MLSREEFEQLVAALLDEPRRADLRARLDAAVAAQPELAALFEEWRRADALLRAGLPALPPLNWTRIQERLAGAVEADARAADAEDAALDAALAQMSRFEAPLDWHHVAQRVSAAVAASDSVARRRRLYPRVAAGVSVLLAAAAALWFAIVPGPKTNSLPPPSLGDPRTDGIAVAVISIPAAAAAQPQQLLIVDPYVSAASDDSTGYY